MWHQRPLVTIPWQRQRDSAENSGTFFHHNFDSVYRLSHQKLFPLLVATLTRGHPLQSGHKSLSLLQICIHFRLSPKATCLMWPQLFANRVTVHGRWIYAKAWQLVSLQSVKVESVLPTALETHFSTILVLAPHRVVFNTYSSPSLIRPLCL